MHGQRGFSLLEATVATVLVASVLMAAAHWVGDAARSGAYSTRASIAAALAAHKLEQLRALRWSVGPDGTPQADLEANLTADPPEVAGGPGLGASPAGALHTDTPGFVDYLTAAAETVRARGHAAYVRRWAVTPLPAFGGLLLEVCVVPAWSAGVTGSSLPHDAVCLATVRTRGLR